MATKVLSFAMACFEDYTCNRHYLFDAVKLFQLIDKKIEKGIEIYGKIWVSLKVRKHISTYLLKRVLW